MLKRILRTLWFGYACLIFIFCMGLLFPLAAAAYILGKRVGSRLSCFLLRLWALGFSLPIGIRYRVEGRQHLPRKPVAGVFVANHQSFLDTPAGYIAIPLPFKPLGKVEMQRIPFFGWFYPFVVVLVDRGSRLSRAKSMQEMKKSLSEGISLFIFPEGRMNRSTEPLTAFQEGAFYLAIDKQVPIYPMAILGSRHLLPARVGEVYPGLVTVRLLPPIETYGLDRQAAPALRDRVVQLINAELTIK